MFWALVKVTIPLWISILKNWHTQPMIIMLGLFQLTLKYTRLMKYYWLLSGGAHLAMVIPTNLFIILDFWMNSFQKVKRLSLSPILTILGQQLISVSSKCSDESPIPIWNSSNKLSSIHLGISFLQLKSCDIKCDSETMKVIPLGKLNIEMKNSAIKICESVRKLTKIVLFYWMGNFSI